MSSCPVKAEKPVKSRDSKRTRGQGKEKGGQGNEVDNFEKDNNPILLFLEEVEEDEILNHETKEVFARYDTFCNENGFTRIAMQTFTKEIKKHLGCDRKDVRLNGKKAIIFIK